MRPFNTGDCLIEVTPLAGLTVYCVCIVISWLKQIVKEGKNILVEFLTGCLQHDPPCSTARSAVFAQCLLRYRRTRKNH
jgi:hypothetical protein